MTEPKAEGVADFPTIERFADLFNTTIQYQAPVLVNEAVQCLWKLQKTQAELAQTKAALAEELEIVFNTAQEMVSVKEQNAALLKRCEEAESELKHFVAAKRFDRSVFDDDTAMVDWILSRARAALQRAETGGEA